MFSAKQVSNIRNKCREISALSKTSTMTYIEVRTMKNVARKFFFINVSESVLDQWREGGLIIQLLSANYLKIHKHMLGQCQF